MKEPQIKRKCIKLAMLGDSEVGKTSICNSYLNIEFSNEYLSTIGQHKYESLMKMRNGEQIKLIIYDTAGQERFRSICLKTIRFIQGIVVVFDLGNKDSFKNVKDWLRIIKENYHKVLIVLFGNKCDIDNNKRPVTTEEIQEFVKENNLTYHETSAKIKKGYSEGFEKLANDAYDIYTGNIGIKLEDKKKVDKTNRSRCFGGRDKTKKTNKNKKKTQK